MKPGQSLARPISEGITFGTVTKRMLAGLGSELMKPYHSSVTIKVMRVLLLLRGGLVAMSLQKFINGLTWPLPGNGIATTWHVTVGSKLEDSIFTDKTATVSRRNDYKETRLDLGD